MSQEQAVATLDPPPLASGRPLPNASSRRAGWRLSTWKRPKRPANTKCVYEADWRVWQECAPRAGIPETSASLGALLGCEVYLEKLGRAPSTIDR